MKKTLFFVSLVAALTGGCAWYDIQPISASSLNNWGKTNSLPEGYIFYQPELYFSATIVTDSTAPTGKANITVTPLWLPNYQKPYRLTTHNFLAKADFSFNLENGWKLTQIADKGDNSIGGEHAGRGVDHDAESGRNGGHARQPAAENTNHPLSPDRQPGQRLLQRI